MWRRRFGVTSPASSALKLEAIFDFEVQEVSLNRYDFFLYGHLWITALSDRTPFPVYVYGMNIPIVEPSAGEILQLIAEHKPDFMNTVAAGNQRSGENQNCRPVSAPVCAAWVCDTLEVALLPVVLPASVHEVGPSNTIILTPTLLVPFAVSYSSVK
jgi:hypothetical protein